MKRAWHLNELDHCWTLSSDELQLLGNKTGATRLRFAVLLKAFQFDGRFPDRRGDVASSVVAHLASQVGVPAEAYFDSEWSERTERHQRAEIREFCGLRPFRTRDESALIAWLTPQVVSFNPETEALRATVLPRNREMHHPVRAFIWVRIHHDGIDNAENRRARANSERQRNDGNGSEAGVAA
jgi:hypothetical protein